LALFSLYFAIATAASAQTIYKGGTCIVATWTDKTAVVIADTKEISSTSANPRAFGNQSSDKTTAAKMHVYGGSMLVTIDGIARMSRNTMTYWDGSSEASRIFSSMNGVPSEAEIYEGLNKWVATLQEQLSSGNVDPPLPPPENDLVTLQIFVRTRDAGFGVFIARFGNKQGKVAVTVLGKLRNANPEETRFVPFGSCGAHLGSDAPKSELTATEKTRYLSLREKISRAKTTSELSLIDLEFERLEVQISHRLATESDPQRVDAPFDIGILDDRSGLWSVERMKN
jgi:hypothetical protein